MAKAKKRQMYVSDRAAPHFYSLADIYWARGGLAVTRIPGEKWAITVASCGFSIGTPRWTNPNEAVATALIWLLCADWKAMTFDQIIRNAPAIQKRYDRAVRRSA